MIYHKDFKIVSISLETDEEMLADFLAKNPMPWKQMFSGEGFNDDIARLYNASWVPSYWLVDRKVLRCHDVRGEDLNSAFNRLINED